jgi:hypothetical protein
MSYRGMMILLGTIPLLVALGSFFAGEQNEVAALRTSTARGTPTTPSSGSSIMMDGPGCEAYARRFAG